MTTTNRAFIKVYRHDAAQTAPLSLNTAEKQRPLPVTLSASVEIVTAAGDYRVRPAIEAPTGSSLFASSIDVLPSPGQGPAAFPFLFKAGLGVGSAPSEQQQRSPRRIDAKSTTKRPLSAFMGRSRAANPAVTKPQPVPSRAGTTVASFRWPPVCRALSQHCAAEFDRVADLLLEHLATGRTMFGALGMFSGGGCTSAALCLAGRVASRGLRTVLVDGNFYSPCLATWLDVIPTEGWQDVLQDNASLTDALIHSVDDQLDVLVLSAKRPLDPLRLAEGQGTSQSAEFLRGRYELTIVDLGAFFDPRSQPVALELARGMEIDASLVVTGPRPLDPRDIATVEEHLRQNGCELIGVIENRTQT